MVTSKFTGYIHLALPGVHPYQEPNFLMDEKDIHRQTRSAKYKFE
jgi:hypothetical protein